jgi:Tfp pilus assembly protein FimT
LIELLVALAIMVLIAAALPIALGRMLPGRRLTVAADQLVTNLQWLQAESIRDRAPGQLTLLPDGYRMEVGPSERRVIIAETTQIHLGDPAGERELQRLTFFPDGTAVPALLAVADSGRRVDLEVRMLTGRVSKIQ